VAGRRQSNEIYRRVGGRARSQATLFSYFEPLNHPPLVVKRLMRILNAIVEAATTLVPIGGANFFIAAP
jgi:hypothetical protein